MSNIRNVFFIRHGQSRENETGVREAGTSPLTDLGKEQAAATAERLKEVGIDIVLSSPYTRALETAKVIADTNKVPMVVAEEAHERKLPSSMIGKHRQDPEVLTAVAKFEYAWTKDVTLDDGESFQEMLTRADKLARNIESRTESSIAVSTHELFSKFFLARRLLGDYLTPDLFINQFLHALRGGNGGITHFILHDGKWVLSTWNDPVLKAE